MPRTGVYDSTALIQANKSQFAITATKNTQQVQQSSIHQLGTRIELTESVAVLSGLNCAKKFTSCDHVDEWLLSVLNWRTFFIVPSLSYQNNFDVA
ncbi:IgGFc-binding protein, partial [Ophiophagus hannah]